MPSKKVVQDIIPSARRSIRLVPLNRAEQDEEIIDEVELKETKRVRTTKARPMDEQEEIKKTTNPKKVKSGRSGFSKILIFLIILGCVAIIALAISLLYSKAIVTVTPEKLDLNVNGNFIAKKDVGTDDSLGYQIITISDQLSRTIPATDGPLIQTKAKGAVTLYNAFSSTTQRIVAGTRLSSNDGLVYKTATSVTIPAKKIVQGKVVFGSVAVSVVADQAGANYNMKPLDLKGDFKFIGYKGTPKYDGFFGRLKTDITGGFSGKKKIISPGLQQATIAELQKEIEAKLLARVTASIPNDYIMFNKSNTIEYQDLATSTEIKDMAEISLKGTMYGIIFNSKSLINFIAKREIQDRRLTEYKIEGLKSLVFKTINDKDFSPKKGNTLSFSLSGPLKVIGVISENELKSKLVGIKVKEIDTVIKDNPSVKHATVLLTPFWMRSFPASVDNITIEYK
jgi:hypothetical protein